MNAFWERVYGNLATTVAGVVAAAATYTYGVGGKLPTNKQEWAFAAASVAMGALGAATKTPAPFKAAPPLMLLLLFLATPAAAQAVCDTTVAPTTSVCGPNNNLSFIMPTTNTDGSPFNDFGLIRVIYGTATPLCVGTPLQPGPTAVVRSMGALGQPVTPLPNTRVAIKLGAITGLPQGKVFNAVQIADLIGNVSGCSPEVTHTYDSGTPNTGTGVQVGP